jgi:glycerol transport system ATP-binding protein
MLPLKATVELSEELGSDMELHLNHMGITLVVLTQEHERHSIGTEIDLFVDPNRLYIYDKVSRELVLKTFTE